MITINVDKAKTIAHDIRRTAREKEFKPYDDIIMKRIPGNDYDQAEIARQSIRDKYTTVQNEIDSSDNIDTIKQILNGI